MRASEAGGNVRLPLMMNQYRNLNVRTLIRWLAVLARWRSSDSIFSGLSSPYIRKLSHARLAGVSSQWYEDDIWFKVRATSCAELRPSPQSTHAFHSFALESVFRLLINWLNVMRTYSFPGENRLRCVRTPGLWRKQKVARLADAQLDLQRIARPSKRKDTWFD